MVTAEDGTLPTGFAHLKRYVLNLYDATLRPEISQSALS
jgi:hypothetical protein